MAKLFEIRPACLRCFSPASPWLELTIIDTIGKSWSHLILSGQQSPWLNVKAHILRISELHVYSKEISVINNNNNNNKNCTWKKRYHFFSMKIGCTFWWMLESCCTYNWFFFFMNFHIFNLKNFPFLVWSSILQGLGPLLFNLRPCSMVARS